MAQWIVALVSERWYCRSTSTGEQSFSLKYPADSWRFYISKFDYLVEILIACQADPADKSRERDRTENALRKKTCWDEKGICGKNT